MSILEPGPRPRAGRRAFAIGFLALVAATLATAQTEVAEETLAEELVVFESSILLQRTERTRVQDLQVQVDGARAEAVAVYSLDEVRFPTTIHADLCAPSFSRLTRAVGMIAAVGERLLGLGPISVVASGAAGDRVLLESSSDTLSFEAALTLLLRSPLGGCETSTPLAGLGRMRRALARLGTESTAPSLLLVYGFDHGALAAEDLRRYQPEFAAVGAELAGQGRTTVLLVPGEGDRRLEEDEVRSALPDPEGPPRVVNLGAVLGAIIAPKRHVPADARILEVATDPRNELLRDLITPGQGRLLAFHRQLESFALDLTDFQVLFYRTQQPPGVTREALVPIEVRRAPSGQLVPSATITGLGATP